MKRITVVVFCGLGIVLTGLTLSLRANGQSEIPTGVLVNSIRLLNTAEVEYLMKNGRFANQDEILSHLKEKGLSKRSAIDLENPKPYELSIATSADGKHYLITLKRPSDMNDKNSWCKTAAFSDDRGVIFLGQAINCEAAPR